MKYVFLDHNDVFITCVMKYGKLLSYQMAITIVNTREILIIIIVIPAFNRYKICYNAGYDTFQ